MPTEVLDVAVVAKIDKLRSELEKIPGITAKESKKMAAVWSKDFKRAERSAERARKQMAREAEQVRDAWKDSSERMASLLGGTFGDISDSILDLGSRFGDLSSKIGGAGGAMVAAGGAFTAGAFAIGWPIWAVVRVIGFMAAGTALGHLFYARILRRVPFAGPAFRRWMIISVSLVLLDVLLKATLAETWRGFLIKLL